MSETVARSAVEVAHTTPVLRTLTITVPKGLIDEVYARELSGLVRDAVLPGFRKGKAPARMVEQRFGKSLAEQSKREAAVNEAEAHLAALKLPVVGRPRLFLEQAETLDGGDVRFRVETEVLPEIGDIDFAGLAVTLPETAVEEADINAELDRLRGEKAVLAPKTDDGATVAAGDRIVVDVKATAADGTVLDYLSGDEKSFFVGKGELPGDLDARITGLGPGTHTFEIATKAEDHPSAPEGTTVTVQVTIKLIEARILPALDDEFARDLGEFDTLEALKTSIRERLAAERRRLIDTIRENELVLALAARCAIEVPPTLVAMQAQEEARSYVAQMTGTPPDKLPARMQGLIPQLAGAFRDRATTSVRTSLLVEHIGRTLNIETGDDDLEAFYAKRSEESKNPLPKIRAIYARNPQMLTELKQRLRNDKIIARIAETAVVTTVPWRDWQPSGSRVAAESAEAPAPDDAT